MPEHSASDTRTKSPRPRPGQRIDYLAGDVEAEPHVGTAWADGPITDQVWALPVGLTGTPRNADAVRVCLTCRFATDRRCCS